MRAVLQAYAEGRIELPLVPKDTPKGKIRYADVPSRNGNVAAVRKPYTAETLAEFIGWGRSHLFFGALIAPAQRRILMTRLGF